MTSLLEERDVLEAEPKSRVLIVTGLVYSLRRLGFILRQRETIGGFLADLCFRKASEEWIRYVTLGSWGWKEEGSNAKVNTS
jgi:hypothetical protein